MSELKRQESNYRLAAAMVVAVFCMGQIPGSIDAAISKISTYFQLSSTSGMYVTTVACLTSVVFSILLGMIAGKKIGFKLLILFCATIELISSIIPFITSNFIVLIILRGFFGIGFGGMQSLENTVATRLISTKKRASILGLGTFFGFGMNCVLQLLGGILADMGWNYVFLNHLLLLIPYAIVVFGCLRLDFAETHEQFQNDISQPDETNTFKSAAPIWILMFFVGIFIAPLLVGCAFAKNIPLLCIMIFIAGAGFSSTQATAMMILGMTVSQKQIAFASAIMMALFNLGMFLSSSYENFIGQIVGDSLYAPLYIGAGILMVLAVIYRGVRT